MTVDEVKRCINKGGVIRCKNVCQREEAVQFLIDIGYELLPEAERWLERGHNDATFLHPGLDSNYPGRCCSCGR